MGCRRVRAMSKGMYVYMKRDVCMYEKRLFEKNVHILEKKPTKETNTYLHTESWRERVMRELLMPCSVLGCWIWCVSAAPPLTPTSFCKEAYRCRDEYLFTYDA